MKQISDIGEWNAFVRDNAGHPLQLWGWGETKSAHGWSVRRYQDNGGGFGAQVLVKRLPRPMHAFAYVPRGPIGEIDASRLDELAVTIQKDFKADAVLVEPSNATFPSARQWRATHNSILLAKTLILDLSCSEDELLATMTKKYRQYIRKSLTTIHVKRVTTEVDLKECMKIYKETARRAKFALHDDGYYEDIHRFLDKDSYVYGAYEGSSLVAFVWLVATPEMAFELYGGVSDRGQELKANYGLKWEAIRSLKSRGVRTYDMNGLLNDGVSNFKRGFASHESQLVGSMERGLSVWYPLWAYGLPFAKRLVRLIRRA